jgi:hypothetical protein
LVNCGYKTAASENAIEKIELFFAHHLSAVVTEFTVGTVDVY